MRGDSEGIPPAPVFPSHWAGAVPGWCAGCLLPGAFHGQGPPHPTHPGGRQGICASPLGWGGDTILACAGLGVTLGTLHLPVWIEEH